MPHILDIIAISCLAGYWSYLIAVRKNRNIILWTILGMIFTFVAITLNYLLPLKRKSKI